MNILNYENRLKLFRWIVFDLFKYDDRNLLNNWCIALRYLILPIETFLYFVTDRKNIYNFLTDTYTIEGVKVSARFIRKLGKLGYIFMVTGIDANGVITIETVCQNHNENGPCSRCGV